MDYVFHIGFILPKLFVSRLNARFKRFITSDWEKRADCIAVAVSVLRRFLLLLVPGID